LKKAKHDVAEIREFLGRARNVEKYLMPAKLVLIAASFIVLWSIMGGAAQGPDSLNHDDEMQIAREGYSIFRWVLVVYSICNLVYWTNLAYPQKRMLFDLEFFRSLTFLIAVTDNMFLVYFIYISEEVTPLWLAAGLIIRNTVLFMDLSFFIIVNSTLAVSYIAQAFLRTLWFSDVPFHFGAEMIRVLLIVLFSTTCWGLYTSWQRRRRVMDEEQERFIRVEKLSLAGQLAGEIAHELKNPLAIMNNALYILNRSQEVKGSKSQKQMKILSDEITRSDKIITELLNYARLAESEIEAADINEIALDAIEEHSQTILAKKIVIKKRLSYNLPNLFIDTVQLKQVFSNLILNACEAVEEEGKLSISTSFTEKNSILVEIEDNGPGMEAKVKERIFEPFYTTKKGGTGIGLSIVNNVLQAYGGEITVESEEDSGTKFSIDFPVRTVKAPKG
jgi:signal transduction histidine kinase